MSSSEPPIDDDVRVFLERRREGDAPASGCIARMQAAWGKALHSYIRRLVPHGPADDLLQNVWVAALGSLPTYNQSGTVRAWLFGIARNICMGYRRRPSRWRNQPLDSDFENDASAEPRLTLPRMKGDVQRLGLTPDELEVLELRADGLTHQEVANVLEITLVAAKARYRSAMEHARQAADCL